jgi:Ca2+/H+ antiporter, TMEM165/GDT1 family
VPPPPSPFTSRSRSLSAEHLFTLIPRSDLDLVAAGLFAAGAIYAWIEGTRNRHTQLPAPKTARGAVTTALVVIFLAEWGDLTQILTANLAAHYHAPCPSPWARCSRCAP